MIKNKIKKLFTNIKQNAGKALLALGVVSTLVVGGSSAVFATEGTGATVSASDLDFTPIITSMTGAISPTDIIIVIGATIAAGAGFVVAWFGIRKVKGALSKGIFKGKF